MVIGGMRPQALASRKAPGHNGLMVRQARHEVLENFLILSLSMDKGREIRSNEQD
jgi:hypothetical protein